ncbi:XkdX family protein [Limosilactobacillus reuteri]
MFQQFKDWYEIGLFTIQDERNGVLTDLITKDEYKEITGQDYDTVAQAQPA